MGALVAAPVGPIGLLIAGRTLSEGVGVGLLSGLGAAAADGLFAAIAASGLNEASHFLMDHQVALSLLGGGVLCVLGWGMVRRSASKAPVRAAQANRGGFGGPGARAFLSTTGLTLTNPMTIALFASVFPGLGLLAQGGALRDSVSLVGGVFLGSLCWWSGLCVTVSMIKHRLSALLVGRINLCAGLLILVMGLGICVKGFYGQ